MTFHLHNGDSTAGTLREAGFPGTHFAFRETLVTGPVPQSLRKEEWLALRAQHLAGIDEKDIPTIEQELAAQDATLDNLSHYDEIVLWFEHDLFCQTHLIYLLDRFVHKPVMPARLSLICVGEFPGISKFFGLGQLTAEQMATLFDTRHEVTAKEFDCAQRAWQSFTSSDPRALVELLRSDLSALPFLRAALLQHLARFPSVHNGLSHAENRLLSLIAKGVTNYMQLCRAFFDAEPAYGLGDLQIQQDLKHMAEATHPLIELTGEQQSDSGANNWHNVSCQLTEIGRQVFANQADFIALNGIDQWLGGVHLTNDNLWRWDGDALQPA